MAGWYAARRPNMSAKAVIALMVLAFALVAAVPVALVVGVFMMLLGHVMGGLALFGGSILVCAICAACSPSATSGCSSWAATTTRTSGATITPTSGEPAAT